MKCCNAEKTLFKSEISVNSVIKYYRSQFSVIDTNLELLENYF